MVMSQSKTFGWLWSRNAGLMTSFSERWNIWPPLSLGLKRSQLFSCTAALLVRLYSLISKSYHTRKVCLIADTFSLTEKSANSWMQDVGHTHSVIHILKSHVKLERGAFTFLSALTLITICRKKALQPKDGWWRRANKKAWCPHNKRG